METVVNLSDAALQIGISRPTLYRYLKKAGIEPEIIAGHPTLTSEQVKAIKKNRNGRPKKKR